MTDKGRERKSNKEKYKQKQKKKKIIKQEKRARESSRECRNSVRNNIRPFYDAFRNLKDKHLLFVIKDTDNMERILFLKKNIGDGNILLTLPVINEEKIAEYLANLQSAETSETNIISVNNEAIKDFIRQYYSVCSNEVIDTPQMNMILFTDCKLLESRADLVPLNVRPYDLNTWYSGDSTSLNGFRVYNGKKLKTFFQINDNLGKTYVFHDTLIQILFYRSLKGKINYSELLSDHEALAKKKFFSTGSFYAIMATNEDELRQRFAKERQESSILDMADNSN